MNKPTRKYMAHGDADASTTIDGLRRERDEAIRVLRHLHDAMVRHELTDGSEEAWMSSFQALMGAAQRAAELLEKAEGH